MQTLADAKRARGCFYMRIPVEHFGTLEFASFAAIHHAGFAAGQRLVAHWAQQGQLPVPGPASSTPPLVSPHASARPAATGAVVLASGHGAAPARPTLARAPVRVRRNSI